MAKNYAIVIGINSYKYVRSLKYAASDAQKMQDFLLKEAGFDVVFHYSDDSPDIDGFDTRPTGANLERLLDITFEQKDFMGAGDNFWFFFSGHGTREQGIDYLIPSDGYSQNIQKSSIAVNYVIQRLQRCGADNIVLILDACREQGNDLSKSIKGMGEQTEEKARQTGVISICSCSPHEYSWELEELQQGAFTYALLEGLGSKGQRATVEKLNEYLKFRVKELVQKYSSKESDIKQQTPRVMADPIEKSYLILIPKYATKPDIATLKVYAYEAQMNREFEKAEKLWIRVLEIGMDIQAYKAIQQIAIERVKQPGIDVQVSSSLTSSPSTSKIPNPIEKEPDLKRIISCSDESLSLDADFNQKGINGSKIQLWEHHEGLNQAWILDREGTIRSAMYPDKCLDANFYQYGADATTVQLWQCNGKRNQHWIIEDGLIKSAAYPNMCLGLDRGAIKNSSRVKLWNCNGSLHQKWIIQPFFSTKLDQYEPKIEPEPKPEPKIELKSEVGVDYSRLKKLLSQEKWKEANEETAKVMLKAANQEKAGWLDLYNIRHFPCTDLQTIDQLWVKYSDGCFGFSVQKNIYLDCGAKPDGHYPGDEIWYKFNEQVGWRVNGKWKDYYELTFDTSAPEGHLPCPAASRGWWMWFSDAGLCQFQEAISFFSHVENCIDFVEPKPEPKIELKSEVGIDYSQLKELFSKPKSF